MRVFINGGVARAYESLTTASAVGITLAKRQIGVRKAKEAFITVETASIRFTVDGTTPTTTATSAVGHLCVVGEPIILTGESAVEKFKCINAVASSGAVVKCSMSF